MQAQVITIETLRTNTYYYPVQLKKKILYSAPSLWLIKNIFFVYIYFIYITSSKTKKNFSPTKQLLDAKKNIIFVLWHGRQLMIPAFMHNLGNFHAMISPHGDGKILAAILGKFKVIPLHGSSNKKGKEALIKAIRILKHTNDSLFITPDGPRGPNRKVNSAVIDIAKHTNSAIIPIIYSAKKAKFARSWDKFMIPAAFNEITIEYGDPIYIDKNIDKSQSEILRQQLENTMNKITDNIDQTLNHKLEPK